MRDELDQLRVELGRRNAPTESVKGFSKIAFDLPSNISTTFADSLTTILVRETTENWMEMYGQLKQYSQDNGHTSVPVHGSSLGMWVNNQRQIKGRNLLQERIRLLDEIGFTWDPYEQEWRDNFEKFKQYVKEHGNAKVPLDDPTLGVWIRT